MMPRVWNNPEFVRHRRSELRNVRAVTVASIVLAVCILIGLGCWASQQAEIANIQRGVENFNTPEWAQRLQEAQQGATRRAWQAFYMILMFMQGAALTFWTLFSCAQSVSGERDRKTWDFQRTTRLTAAEILIGKLMGEPVLVYFAVLCALPVALIAGLSGGVPFGAIVSSYVFLFAVSIFLGLAGMWLSTLLESRTRGVGLIGAVALYALTLSAKGFRDSALPGLAAFSPLTAMQYLPGMPGRDMTRPMIFGHEIPWLAMALLLVASFSAWLVVMLVRNLKRDYPEIRPLSRWQAVGCAAFLNFLIYALLKPMPADTYQGPWFTDSKVLAGFAVGINGLILFLMGLATLTPQERLKVWRRKRAAGQAAIFADDGLPWPWLGISAIVAYALMVWGLLAWDQTFPLEMGTLKTAAIRLLLVAVFVTRDVMFLQWCMLTRLRQPIVKGVLFLGLYYAAAGVFTGMGFASSEAAGKSVLALLTPIAAFDPAINGLAFPGAVYLGLALQVGLIVVVMMAITGRLQRPTQLPAAA